MRFFTISFVIVLSALFTTALHAQEATDTATQSQNAQAQQGEYRYISDDLFTYLRAGPGPDFRLIGSVNAGTQIQLLDVDREAGYAEIIDNRQRTGWVEIRFVSRTPTIRENLATMQAAVAEKEAQMQNMQKEVAAVMANLAKSEKQKSALNRQITQQLEKIGELNERIEQGERANNMQWFTRGAMLAVVSLIIGYLMGLFARKSKHGDRLM